MSISLFLYLSISLFPLSQSVGLTFSEFCADSSSSCYLRQMIFSSLLFFCSPVDGPPSQSYIINRASLRFNFGIRVKPIFCYFLSHLSCHPWVFFGIYIHKVLWNCKYNVTRVKLLYTDHPCDTKIVAGVDRWSLFRSHLCYKTSKW